MTRSTVRRTLLALVLSFGFPPGVGAEEPADSDGVVTRGVAVSRFAMELGGSVDQVYAVATQTSSSGSVQRSPTPPAPISLQVGMGMSEGLYQWISESFAKGGVTRSGVIHACDLEFRSKAIQSFSNAILSEVSFLPLDAHSKAPVLLNVALAPEALRSLGGSGAVIGLDTAAKKARFQSSNFRFTMDPLPTRSVRRIEGLTWRQEQAPRMGATRDQAGGAIHAVAPRVKLTMGMEDFARWKDWADAFVAGLPGAHPLTGAVDFLSSDSRSTLARIVLYDLTPIKLSLSPIEANQEAVASFQVELQASRMGFRR